MRTLKILRLFPVLVMLALSLSLAARPAAAHARFGVFVGFPPLVVGPPVYYPAPIYAAPPAYYYYAPPAYSAPAPAGFTCFAGPYVCPLITEHPVGGPCVCPAYGGEAGGTVR